jgi:cellulose synthase/poly-beta-1,6-N-acetylglucosamine synthase-like glycosyltransferase
VAGRAHDCGQKVHNLRAATSRLSPRIEYLAFADSDARPSPHWLRMLISRLHRPHIGAMTGYRWLVPEQDTAANHLLYSLNCNVMSLLGRNSHYLLWGGSWAIRRAVFEKIGLHSAWQGALSDDLVAARVLKQAKMPVRFEPSCVVASPVDHSLPEAISFLRRQYQISRFYSPRWWIFALLATALTNLAWLGNLAVLAYGLLTGAHWSWIPAGVMSVLYVLAVCRGMLRQDLVDAYFPHLRKALRRAKRFDIWLQPLVSLVHGMIVCGAGVGRRISWRGISYRLSRGGKVERIWRADDPPVLPMPGIALETPHAARKRDSLLRPACLSVGPHRNRTQAEQPSRSRPLRLFTNP